LVSQGKGRGFDQPPEPSDWLTIIIYDIMMTLSMRIAYAFITYTKYVIR